jgi:hypothetical protein
MPKACEVRRSVSAMSAAVRICMVMPLIPE